MSWVIHSKPYTQALEIQTLLMADLRDEETKPIARAALARAWEVIEERKRILRGKPLPGSKRPATEAPKTKGVKLLLPPTEEP